MSMSVDGLAGCVCWSPRPLSCGACLCAAVPVRCPPTRDRRAGTDEPEGRVLSNGTCDRVLLGDGSGHFGTAYDLGEASDRSYSGHLVDLDRDGDLDVVISNDAPDPKLVYLNDGHGHFRVGSRFGRAEWPTRNASVADLDGDSLPDVVVANRDDRAPANYVCPNRGGGRFDADCLAFSHEPVDDDHAGGFRWRRTH